ncbi:MAG: 5-(carboxyamino)imidazole ribonucleotide synthase [Candidatus Eiseniibacteriota bacterium]
MAVGDGAPGVIAPGAALGILGGGQLGRMTALAARPLGYRISVLDPDPSCAARPVVERCVTGAFDDPNAAAELAREVSVVTLEIEKIAPAALAAAGEHAPVRPAASVLEIVQDRTRQKRWLAGHGFPVGPFRIATTEEEFVEAIGAFAGRVFAKSSFGGYDGRGQASFEGDGTSAGAGADAEAAAAVAAAARAQWHELGEHPCVVEQALDLDAELSVLVARSARGELSVYPVARNHHERRILFWSQIPGGFDPALERAAQTIATDLAVALDVVGLLCVELFLAKDGRLLVNELAPRPHNSYHATIECAATSQFEQLVRAVCGLPLGATDVVRPGAIVNLLGGVWARGRAPAFEQALALKGVRLHLYGKGEARPGRKMGHLAALADTPEAARALALAAYAKL